MSDKPLVSAGPRLKGPGRLLIDRLRERVDRADRAIERQESARRPRVGRRRRATTPVPAVPTLSREVQALRAVFTDLGAAHGQYRRRSGERVSPGLRTAAEAFKAAPSLATLVRVAEFFDDLDLLDW